MLSHIEYESHDIYDGKLKNVEFQLSLEEEQNQNKSLKSMEWILNWPATPKHVARPGRGNSEVSLKIFCPVPSVGLDLLPDID